MIQHPVRSAALPLCLIAALSACHGSKPAGEGSVTMHDMEVVDGTANDSMVDLDNAAQDGTPLANAGGLPGAVPMGPAKPSASQPSADNAAAPAEPGNSSSAP